MTLRVALAYLAEQSASAQYRCKFLGEGGKGEGGGSGGKGGRRGQDQSDAGT